MENGSLGEGLITGAVALRKEFSHHQEKAQQGRSLEVSLSLSLPALPSLAGFPTEPTKKPGERSSAHAAPESHPARTLNRGEREFVF